MEKESLSLIMSKVIALQLFPKIIQELKNLEIEEHIIKNSVYNGVNLRSFKFKSDGKVFAQVSQESIDFIEFYDINNHNINEISENKIETLRSFMLKLSYELTLLKMMRQEIEDSIRNVKGNIDVDVLYKMLITEK